MRMAACWIRVAACLLGTAASAEAQADRYAPTVLQIASTPRAATLANTTAARDIEAVFSNPAMVGVAVGTVVASARFDAATMLAFASSSSLGPSTRDRRAVPGLREPDDLAAVLLELRSRLVAATRRRAPLDPLRFRRRSGQSLRGAVKYVSHAHWSAHGRGRRSISIRRDVSATRLA